jgi:hypothetical protein
MRNGFIDENEDEYLFDVDEYVSFCLYRGNPAKQFRKSDTDEYVSSRLFSIGHTDFSMKAGITGVGQYCLNRVNSKSAGDNNIYTLDSKLRILVIIDMLLALFGFNGYTYACFSNHKLSNRELIDIEWFLLQTIEVNICNELSYRILSKVTGLLNKGEYTCMDRIKRADIGGDEESLNNEMRKLSEKNDTGIEGALARLTIGFPPMLRLAWWRLY